MPDRDPPTTPDEASLTASDWDFAGWGNSQRIDDIDPAVPVDVHMLDSAPAHKLGQLEATAICGNDITSSCLYVSALCAIQAGPYAPIALAIVAALLFLFRRIYTEVGTALPLNGGAYNVLLNTSTKGKASLAACLTLLSYMATAVISANEAMHYAHNLWDGLPVLGATVVLLVLFAFLNVVGISESAKVAVGIFVIHISTLTILVVVASFAVLQDTTIFAGNWASPPQGGLGKAIFFGFAAAMLGISGFESSANFIEEQKPKVFPKTLRNMWIAVAVFNPLISMLSLGLVPLEEFPAHREDLLAHMGALSAGQWLKMLISVDAVLVLSGAVLTSYVGVTGLVRRMSLDRCLPQILLAENAWRRTNHWIILLFLGLCVSILLLTKGDISALAGVYTLSFLGVMALFAIGNMLLKVKRGSLPRAAHASWPAVVLALLAVIAGIVGNVLIYPAYVKVFLVYLAVTVAAVGVMFQRINLLKIALYVSSAILDRTRAANDWVRDRVVSRVAEIGSHAVIFFAKGDGQATLNRAALYVLQNEQTRRMKVVHVYEEEDQIPAHLAEHLKMIDHLYPSLRIDFVAVKGTFGPQIIEHLSRRFAVPKNYMFIGCPGDRFPHNIAELGGVRLIV